jgi:hypothetical protein
MQSTTQRPAPPATHNRQPTPEARSSSPAATPRKQADRGGRQLYLSLSAWRSAALLRPHAGPSFGCCETDLYALLSRGWTSAAQSPGSDDTQWRHVHHALIPCFRNEQSRVLRGSVLGGTTAFGGATSGGNQQCRVCARQGSPRWSPPYRSRSLLLCHVPPRICLVTLSTELALEKYLRTAASLGREAFKMNAAGRRCARRGDRKRSCGLSALQGLICA